MGKLTIILLAIFVLALPLVGCASKPLTIAITDPVDGAIVTDADITVLGQVSNYQAAVTVNGERAYVIQKTCQVKAYYVHLVEGQNTITAVAKLKNEEATSTITVTYTPSE